MHDRLRAAFEAEMRSAAATRSAGDLDRAFGHLERAHVLGQQHVGPHVRSHVAMLGIGWQRRDGREVFGQLLRIPAAVIASSFGVPPTGNTGGANRGFFEEMEIPADLAALLDGRNQENPHAR